MKKIEQNPSLKKIKIAVIYGGKSGEHEVSLSSAKSVMENLDKERYEVTSILIKQDGSNYKDLVGLETDVVFPVLHGTYGEDGTIQGLFELIDIPYVGCGVLSSALGMDKEFMKKAFDKASLPITHHRVLYKKDIEDGIEDCIKSVEKEFKYPVFIKPANLGSSVGISKAHSKEELIFALKLAATYDRKVLVEETVERAREIEVSVMGNTNPVASLPGEVIPANEFYDYEAKYVSEKTEVLIPAELSDEMAKKIRSLAITAYRSIDASGLSRVDFLLDREKEAIYVSEINTMPGFTSHSMYPKMWEASGVSYSELLDKLIEFAFETYKEKKELKTSRD